MELKARGWETQSPIVVGAVDEGPRRPPVPLPEGPDQGGLHNFAGARLRTPTGKQLDRLAAVVVEGHVQRLDGIPARDGHDEHIDRPPAILAPHLHERSHAWHVCNAGPLAVDGVDSSRVVGAHGIELQGLLTDHVTGVELSGPEDLLKDIEHPQQELSFRPMALRMDCAVHTSITLVNLSEPMASAVASRHVSDAGREAQEAPRSSLCASTPLHRRLHKHGSPIHLSAAC